MSIPRTAEPLADTHGSNASPHWMRRCQFRARFRRDSLCCPTGRVAMDPFTVSD